MNFSTLFFFSLVALATSYPIFHNAASSTHSLAQAKDTATTKTTSKAAANVQKAADAFAGDVATVSNSLNKLATTTDKSTIASLAKAGFVAEMDEDQHRAVLNTAAGSAGKSANAKIVKNTPVVLKGLQAMMNTPTQASVKKNLATVENAR